MLRRNRSLVPPADDYSDRDRRDYIYRGGVSRYTLTRRKFCNVIDREGEKQDGDLVTCEVLHDVAFLLRQARHLITLMHTRISGDNEDLGALREISALTFALGNSCDHVHNHIETILGTILGDYDLVVREELYKRRRKQHA